MDNTEFIDILKSIVIYFKYICTLNFNIQRFAEFCMLIFSYNLLYLLQRSLILNPSLTACTRNSMYIMTVQLMSKQHTTRVLRPGSRLPAIWRIATYLLITKEPSTDFSPFSKAKGSGQVIYNTKIREHWFQYFKTCIALQ